MLFEGSYPYNFVPFQKWFTPETLKGFEARSKEMWRSSLVCTRSVLKCNTGTCFKRVGQVVLGLECSGEEFPISQFSGCWSRTLDSTATNTVQWFTPIAFEA